MLEKPVTRELVKSGYNVTALVRDAEKAIKTFPSGVNFVEGDLQSLDSIKASMRNADAIYISIANTCKDKENKFNAEKHGLDNILSTAKELKLKQAAFLSFFRQGIITVIGGCAKLKRTALTGEEFRSFLHHILCPELYGELS